MKHVVGPTSNNIPVYVDLIRSQAANHIAQQPYLLQLAKEALRGIKASGTEVKIEHDMGRVIGYDFIVNTTEKDTILYARLLRETIYTRFVKNGKPNSTQFLTIVLARDENSEYELQDVWIGRKSPPRPGSDHETSESKPYWASHAFVLDKQPMQLGTVTKVCPYPAE
jgi:hypothetical protein